MVTYTRANNETANDIIHRLASNPPAYEGNQRVNLRWVDELGFEWASNFTCFHMALDFIPSVQIVAINAEWY